MAEKYGKIRRTQQNTLKQTVGITWRRQKRIEFVQMLEIWAHED